MIKNTLSKAWSYLFELWRPSIPTQLRIILAAQLILFFGFLVVMMAFGLPVLDVRFTIFPVFFLLSLAPTYVAWARPVLCNDTILLLYSCLVLTPPLLVYAFMSIVHSRRANHHGNGRIAATPHATKIAAPLQNQ
jgi:hypothetical protein